MDRWKRLNVFVSLGGLAIFLISLLFIRYNPLIYCLAAFGLGIAWKGFKNIYKNVDPPNIKKTTDTYNNRIPKHRKKKKRKK